MGSPLNSIFFIHYLPRDWNTNIGGGSIFSNLINDQCFVFVFFDSLEGFSDWICLFSSCSVSFIFFCPCPILSRWFIDCLIVLFNSFTSLTVLSLQDCTVDTIINMVAIIVEATEKKFSVSCFFLLVYVDIYESPSRVKRAWNQYTASVTLVLSLSSSFNSSVSFLWSLWIQVINPRVLSSFSSLTTFLPRFPSFSPMFKSFSRKGFRCTSNPL